MVMKRLSAPRSLPITRKSGGRFVTEGRPGPHSKSESIPLSIVIRSLLKMADNAREAKSVVKAGKVMVDGAVRKDHKFPVGIFDTVTVSDESYRMVPTEKGFSIVKIDKKESGLKLCKIANKKSLRGGKTQINLNDGKNIIVDKDSYKTGDSLLLSLPAMKVEKHIPRKEGAECMITRGKNRSRTGSLKSVEKVRGSDPNAATIAVGDKEIRIPHDIVFVLGEKKTEITVN